MSQYDVSLFPSMEAFNSHLSEVSAPQLPGTTGSGNIPPFFQFLSHEMAPSLEPIGSEQTSNIRSLQLPSNATAQLLEQDLSAQRTNPLQKDVQLLQAPVSALGIGAQVKSGGSALLNGHASGNTMPQTSDAQSTIRAVSTVLLNPASLSEAEQGSNAGISKLVEAGSKVLSEVHEMSISLEKNRGNPLVTTISKDDVLRQHNDSVLFSRNHSGLSLGGNLGGHHGGNLGGNLGGNSGGLNHSGLNQTDQPLLDTFPGVHKINTAAVGVQSGVNPAATDTVKIKDELLSEWSRAQINSVDSSKELPATLRDYSLLGPQKVAGTAETATRVPSFVLPSQMNSASWSEDFSGRLSWMLGNKVNNARLELNPQSLGLIKVNISVNAEQQVNLHMQIQTHSVKEAVDAAMPRLREMLEQQGLSLNNVSVSNGLSDQQKSMYGEKDQKYTNRVDAFSEDDVETKDVQSQRTLSGWVDYYV